jgi:hypothetical protein
MQNPDHQEALSRRYSAQALTVLQLRSGNIAVFAGMPRDLIAIVEPQLGLDAIFRLTPSPPPAVDLADLGLL